MSRMHICTAALLTMVGTCAAAPVAADDAAIRAALDRVIAAWAHVDAEGMARAYADDADLIVPDGTMLAGKENIKAFYAAVFERGYGGSVSHADIVRVRKLDATDYLVDGTWNITGIKQAGKADAQEAGVFTAVFVHRHGRWQIAALREQTGTTSLHAAQ